MSELVTRKPVVDVEKFRVNSNYILLRKCTNDHVRDDNGQVLVQLTDKSLAHTNWMEIIDVGPDCKLFTKDCIGYLTYAPNFAHDLMNFESTFGKDYWMCREISQTGKPVLQPFILIEED